MEEDKKLVKNLLEKTYFTAWKKENINKEKYANYSTLEIQINTRCDLGCLYCYYNKYGEKLYPKNISKDSEILENLDSLINWLEENQLYPKIEPFSGEMFFQEIGFTVLERIVDFYIRNNINGEDYQIMIPTNFSFIFSKDRTDRLENILYKCRDHDICINLSASIDGKYVENENRPFKNGRIRDDDYYDKVFSFCSKWGFSFHPMIYSNKIELWIKNFLWFQEMFKKYNLPNWFIYLLEVRNVEWSRKQIREAYKVFKFIANYFFEQSNFKGREFVKYITDKKLSNVFCIFYRVGRGTGCSTQSTLQLRLGDLSHSICHRACYEQHVFWKFVKKNKKIVDIEIFNAPLFLAHQTLDEDNFPVCESCFLKYLCTGQCLGSMFETNRSPFVPIPTVCMLEHAKVSAILDMTIETGLFPYFYEMTTTEKKASLEIYYERFKKGKNHGF